MKPKDYLEFNYEGVTICMSDKKQVIITHMPVGGTYMYHLGMVDRGHTPWIMPEDDMTRTWSAGPAMIQGEGVFKFYGEALKQARAVCGWVWEAHPTREEEQQEIQEEDMKDDARHAEMDYEREGYWDHPSLTNGERNQGGL